MKKYLSRNWVKYIQPFLLRTFLPYSIITFIQNYIRLHRQRVAIVKSLYGSQELVDTLDDNQFELVKKWMLFRKVYMVLESIQIPEQQISNMTLQGIDGNFLKQLVIDNIKHMLSSDDAKVIAQNTHLNIIQPKKELIVLVSLTPSWYMSFRLIRKDFFICLGVNVLLGLGYFLLNYFNLI